MKKGITIIIILSLLMILSAGVSGRRDIYVPADYETIQGAIDVAFDDDVILVAPGIYEENINFLGKAITVGSLYHTTQDTSYISLTVIDGGQNGSVVTFESEEGNNSVLTGFTIRNGNTSSRGGGIFADDYCSPTLNNLRISDNHAEYAGGGFYFGESCTGIVSHLLVENNSANYGGGGTYWYYCEMIMEESIIRNNAAEYKGGGISNSGTFLHIEDVLIENNTANDDGGGYYSSYYSDDTFKNVFIHQNQAERGGGILNDGVLYLENVTITENYAETGGGLYAYSPVYFAEELQKRCSIYLNDADIYCGKDIYSRYNNPLEVYLTTFSVLHPNRIYANPMNIITFDILTGILPQIAADLYVSPSGDDTNSGLNSGSAFRTIEHALSMVLATAEEPRTIYLEEGIYSTATTGESFPVYLPENIILHGENRENVILDAGGNSSVIYMENVDNIKVCGLTITNGYNNEGGGIYCDQSNPILENLKIINNHAVYEGGGIYQNNCANQTLKNLIITDNTAGNAGGGMCLYNISESINLLNLTIANNIAGEPGGGGACICNGEEVRIVNSLFWDNMPEEIYLFDFSDVEAVIGYSDINGGEEGFSGWYNTNWLFGNIMEDPLFVDAENGNYTLQEGSPCIDAGTAYFEYEGDLILVMEEGDYFGSAPDMGAYEYVPEVDNDEEGIVPQSGSVCVYPNPFNPETTIKYQLPEAGKTRIEVYNIRGQKVATLMNEEQEEGEHDFRWEAGGQNSGIYFVRIKSRAFEDVKKVILLK